MKRISGLLGGGAWRREDASLVGEVWLDGCRGDGGEVWVDVIDEVRRGTGISDFDDGGGLFVVDEDFLSLNAEDGESALRSAFLVFSFVFSW